MMSCELQKRWMSPFPRPNPNGGGFQRFPTPLNCPDPFELPWSKYSAEAQVLVPAAVGNGERMPVSAG